MGELFVTVFWCQHLHPCLSLEYMWRNTVCTVWKVIPVKQSIMGEVVRSNQLIVFIITTGSLQLDGSVKGCGVTALGLGGLFIYINVSLPISLKVLCHDIVTMVITQGGFDVEGVQLCDPSFCQGQADSLEKDESSSKWMVQCFCRSHLKCNQLFHVT